MKPLFAAGAFLLLATFALPAFALTTDEGKFSNDDGTAKFSDPDDQQPAFAGGGDSNSSNGSNGFSINSYGFGSDQPGLRPNGPTLEWGDGGSDAFDHAYNHQTQ